MGYEYAGTYDAEERGDNFQHGNIQKSALTADGDRRETPPVPWHDNVTEPI